MSRVPANVFAVASGWTRKPLAPAIASLAFSLGLGIAVLVWSFYTDARHYFDNFSAAGDKEDYIVLTKSISVLNALSPEKSAFSERELRNIGAQDFVRGIEPVIANGFDAEALVQMGSSRYRSEIFFESVSDSFLGENSAAWKWTAPASDRRTAGTAGNDTGITGDDATAMGVVPVILPRSFLALYNLGFATARGLPQIPESALGAVPIQLALRGQRGSVTVQARVVALTDRIDTFLVPMTFMTWANENLAGIEAARAGENPRRLVVRIDDPANPVLEAFLRDNRYEVADASKGLREAAYILNAVLGGLLALAVILIGLAALVFSLNLSLFVTRSRNDLAALVLIGFAPGRLAFLSTLSFVLPLSVFTGITMWLAGMIRAAAAAFLSERSIPVSESFEWFVALPVVAFLVVSSFAYFGYLRRQLVRSVAE